MFVAFATGELSGKLNKIWGNEIIKNVQTKVIGLDVSVCEMAPHMFMYLPTQILFRPVLTTKLH